MIFSSRSDDGENDAYFYDAVLSLVSWEWFWCFRVMNLFQVAAERKLLCSHIYLSRRQDK